MKSESIHCTHCNVNWSSGQYSEVCDQCGGGALLRSCPVCNGQCGAEFSRAVLDSWDTGIAHWIGACRLPLEEQQKLMQEQSTK